MSSRKLMWRVSAMLVAPLLAATGMVVVSQSSAAADPPPQTLQVYKFKKGGFAPLTGMTFGGESCTRTAASPAWQCESLPSTVTEMPDSFASKEINQYITMASPVGSSCSVAASDSSASMQKVRLWEVNAPQGYDLISGDFTVCFTATGWAEMSNSAGDDMSFFADEYGGVVQFFDSPLGSTGPTVLYPSVTLTGVCGTGNDTVQASTSSDYTSGSPVWSGTQVSVAFTMNQGVTNKTFPNGQQTTTVTAVEVNTQPCATETPTPTPTPTVPPTSTPTPTTPPTATPTSTPTPTPAPQKVAVPKTKVKQKCGANNDKVRPAKGSLFTSKASKWRKGRLKVTYTANGGYVFKTGANKVTKIVRDKNRACS